MVGGGGHGGEGDEDGEALDQAAVGSVVEFGVKVAEGTCDNGGSGKDVGPGAAKGELFIGVNGEKY